MYEPTTTGTFESPNDIPADILQDLDAILVLGGGVPLSLDEPPVFVQRRCDDAAQVYQQQQQQNSRLAVLCLSAGTAHLPQLLSNDGLPIWESTASSAYLLKHHGDIIPANQIFAETTSYDTIGNAFYARTSFTDLAGWRTLLVCTNEFHMPRTRAIFEWIFGIDTTTTTKYKLYFLASPNVGLTEQAVQARKEREAKSLTSVQQHLAPKYQSMRDVWTFLTHDHALYTAPKLVERGRTQTTHNNDSTDDITNQQAALKESYGGGGGTVTGKK